MTHVPVAPAEAVESEVRRSDARAEDVGRRRSHCPRASAGTQTEKRAVRVCWASAPKSTLATPHSESRLLALMGRAVSSARLALNRREHVPPKRNYDFEKRRKEQDRKTKKDLKRAEREQRRNERRVDEAPTSENTDSST